MAVLVAMVAAVAAVAAAHIPSNPTLMEKKN